MIELPRDASVAVMTRRRRMIASSIAKRDSLLFVYGTLRPFTGIPMARWLARVAVPMGAGRTRGRLYDLGAYPGLVAPRRRGEWVSGELYRLRSAHRILRVLDRYEAGPSRTPRFVRVRRRVEVARGRIVNGWLYLYQQPTLLCARVVHGDYAAHVHDVRVTNCADAGGGVAKGPIVIAEPPD
jgi:gamma-glutamylcyclotransferase (GGCT)/AIG2-like uncharacterized protein YtfP